MTDNQAPQPGAVERPVEPPDEQPDGQPLEQSMVGEQVAVLRRSWKYIARKTVREFGKDQCIDSAAALTFYAVLAIFPATLAVISLLHVVGQGRTTADAMLDIAESLGPADMADTLRQPIEAMTTAPAAGWGLLIGLAGALWSASGYVGAFGRAMNHIYEVHEGRPFWKLRPTMLLVTLVAVVLIGLVGLGLVVTGPVAHAIGDSIGLRDTTVTLWNVAKWPVILVMIVVVVALLYWATPNIRHSKFRWITAGSVLAILTWVAASLLLALYVSRFANYDKTYGSLAGVVVFLVWLYVTNIALLFGAEVDAEIERGRELQAGLPAEDTLQLPPRDVRATEKKAAKLAKDVELGRALREQAAVSVPTSGRSDPVGVVVGAADPIEGAASPVPSSLVENRRAWGAGRGSAADLLIDRSGPSPAGTSQAPTPAAPTPAAPTR